MTEEQEAYLRLFQYYEDHGDDDKGRMIGVVTWILGIGLAILGYIATRYLEPALDPRSENTLSTTVISFFGLVVSSFAACMVLFFSRHANDNFMIAEKCAGRLLADMRDLINPVTRNEEGEPEFERFGQQWKEDSRIGKWFGIMVGPIFPVYFGLSCFLALVFFGLFVLSLAMWVHGPTSDCPAVLG